MARGSVHRREVRASDETEGRSHERKPYRCTDYKADGG
jgi:hypothetical protein